MKLKKLLMLVLALLMCATIVSCDVAKPNDSEEITRKETSTKKTTTETNAASQSPPNIIANNAGKPIAKAVATLLVSIILS